MAIIKPDTGKFLTANDVKTGDLVTFITEAKEVDKEFKGKAKKVIEVEVELPDGFVKTASLNGTSRNLLIAHYGEDTNTWVGKQGRCEVINQKVGSEMKRVLYITDPLHDVAGEMIHA